MSIAEQLNAHYERFYLARVAEENGIPRDKALLLLESFGGIAAAMCREEVKAILTLPDDEVRRLGAIAKAEQDARIAAEHDAG